MTTTIQCGLGSCDLINSFYIVCLPFCHQLLTFAQLVPREWPITKLLFSPNNNPDAFMAPRFAWMYVFADAVSKSMLSVQLCDIQSRTFLNTRGWVKSNQISHLFVSYVLTPLSLHFYFQPSYLIFFLLYLSFS